MSVYKQKQHKWF